jgi:DNA-binding Lrp family transcriptional regulator
MINLRYHPDHADEQLIAGLRTNKRPTVSDLARLTGMARGTVHSRLDRLEQTGVITGYGPDVDPHNAGFDVLAFTTLAIAQGAHERVVDGLRAIAEIVEIHTVTGAGDLLLRIVARSNDHLHEILQRVSHLDDVVRTETQLALSTSLHHSVADLITREVASRARSRA